MCVEMQSGLKHFNAASSRTITEYRCAAGTQMFLLLPNEACLCLHLMSHAKALDKSVTECHSACTTLYKQ